MCLEPRAVFAPPLTNALRSSSAEGRGLKSRLVFSANVAKRSIIYGEVTVTVTVIGFCFSTTVITRH